MWWLEWRRKAARWWFAAAETNTSLKLLWFMLPLFALALVVVHGGAGGRNFFWPFNSSSLQQYNYSPETKTEMMHEDVTNKSSSSTTSIITSNNQNQETQKGLITTSSRKSRRYSKLEMLEAELAKSRASIQRSSGNLLTKDDNGDDFVPNGPMYWNASAFHRSYLEMEKRLKVYVYKEGDPPVFHYGPCKQTYAIEGYFIQAMDVSPFKTNDPEEAHLFFLPISITMLTEVIYIPKSNDWSLMKKTAFDYVNIISHKYSFWNRSLGADHFMLACHDWGPEISFAVPNLHNNSIRALCNANTSERFDPKRDVSIPEIHLPLGTTEGLLGGPPPSDRPVLVFYSGGLHGPIRPILMEHWGDKHDDEVQIHSYLPKNVSYRALMRKSKYCICPSGYEVASPRMVEALYTGCVPVLIKEGYVIPFSDVFDWKKFAVIVPVSEIPNLKRILKEIPQKKYLRMQKRGILMRRHFEINNPPRRYDVFHMILHSIWLRRLNVRVHDVD